MDARGELVLQNVINAALAGQARQPLEGGRDDLDAKMRLPARPVAGMAGMEMRFVGDLEPLGRQGGGELALNPVGDAHDGLGEYVLSCQRDGRIRASRQSRAGLAWRPEQSHTGFMDKNEPVEKAGQESPDFWGLEEQPPLRACDHPDCSAEGLFRAPKGRDRLSDYFWFCLDHVRDYNRRWDFYRGMSQREIEAQIRRDTVWQRPSWPLGAGGRHEARLESLRFRDYFHLFGAADAKREESRPKPHGPEAEALAVFELEPPVTLIELKARYKALVKRHHPDANGGDKDAEERLKVIIQAYTTLKSGALA
jgi:hypothetical protein